MVCYPAILGETIKTQKMLTNRGRIPPYKPQRGCFWKGDHFKYITY
jgi:hypothetical protein